jgi:hypothetical protein
MKRPTLTRRTAFIGLALVLALGMAPLVSSQESGQSDSAPAQAEGNCVSCHTDKGIMEGLGSSLPELPQLGVAECCAVELPPQEAWERIYVGDAEFLASIHNLYGCIGCHDGQEGTLDRQIAHQGLVPDPTTDPEKACGACHSTEVEMAATGLHQTLSGFHTVLEGRGADFSDPAMQQAFDQQCATCHASCGQCHVSRPSYAGGGLINGHQVQKFPAPEESCAACHGARAAAEFTGSNSGVQGSVHWLQGDMTCYDCHNITEFHGSGTARTNRYDGEGMPRCTTCHPQADPSQTEENLAHDIHWDKVACTVCHTSGPYSNCYGCHVGTDDDGRPSVTLDESQLQFKIGRNPNPDEVHPWEYVLVRHVPVEPDTFVAYGDVLLSEFDSEPTWKLATPHNIQRITPQNATCNNCHGQAELFLTADDVRPARWEADANVIVDQVPPRTELYRTGEEEAEPVSECVADPVKATHIVPESCQPELCTQCHPRVYEGDWTLANENIHTLYALVEPKGDAIVCEDCHSPQGSFDWAAEGYSQAQVAELVWDEFPSPQPLEESSSSQIWLVGIGLVIAISVGAPVVLRRRRGG